MNQEKACFGLRKTEKNPLSEADSAERPPVFVKTG